MKTKLCPGWVLALLCTVLFFYGFYLGGVQLVISEVSREYGQNAAGMGGLVSFMFLSGNSISSNCAAPLIPPSGFLISCARLRTSSRFA